MIRRLAGGARSWNSLFTRESSNCLRIPAYAGRWDRPPLWLGAAILAAGLLSAVPCILLGTSSRGPGYLLSWMFAAGPLLASCIWIGTGGWLLVLNQRLGSLVSSHQVEAARNLERGVLERQLVARGITPCCLVNGIALYRPVDIGPEDRLLRPIDSDSALLRSAGGRMSSPETLLRAPCPKTRVS